MGFTKELYLQIQEEIASHIKDVDEGEISRLDCLYDFRQAKKSLEASLEAIKHFETKRINELAADAAEYPEGYRGLKITEVKGRELFDFKSIPKWQDAERSKKNIEDMFKSAFKGVVKGVVQTTEENGVKMWIDDQGELQPLPVLSIGKSFLKIEEIKPKK